MARNIIDKIWDAHVVQQISDFPDMLYIDRMLVHEVTSPQAFDKIRELNIAINNPKSIIATVDHSISTSPINRLEMEDKVAQAQVEKLRNNVKEFNLDFYDFESQHQGVVHVTGPELGFTLPGITLVCGDSHTSTHGAFGALAFGIGTSEIGHVLATNCILQYRPKTMKVEFVGKPSKLATAKDIVMKLIANIGIGGAGGHVIEYTGQAVKNMTMEERMTLCNMSIECGARAGLVAPDKKTFDYLRGKKYAPQDAEFDKAIEEWKKLESDTNAHFDKHIKVDIENLGPMVTWGINPQHAINISAKIPNLKDIPSHQHKLAQQAYDYTKFNADEDILGKEIQWAFVGSCTNGRIEDMRAVAEVLKGRRVSKNVTMYIVPGSEQVRKIAIEEGLDKIFTDAGADFRMPGCSMCLAMNDDKVPAGQRCISTSNRNFIGRQGKGSITHLASPQTVAASAVMGKICSVDKL
ncbi:MULTISPECIES: 3-isopropylmalate dehydratase large subunit [unclassified Francisella]|uniref:3-isopropylmalate dehydratase large subunit n=1 Tax=unclassified Francisella TaxID=2610885 RepID=UPI002E2EE396|nr:MULTISPECIES: 3-isopropylmalate dehydratase large subunit [unclassified Francisella]MED7819148.1 3-isopropylmalate dehydratase large subunit [Francisella sp. 19S2-4]MED7830379.1 3-isopropylmalate dehydratase large subunit [Francisella sp. 19S2-10]